MRMVAYSLSAELRAANAKTMGQESCMGGQALGEKVEAGLRPKGEVRLFSMPGQPHGCLLKEEI